MQLMCLIKCSHGFSSTLTSWGINFVVRSDAKVNQVLKSGAVLLIAFADETFRADALLYLRTTLGEECCDITQVAGTYGTPTRCA
ncbi:hypothetical protein QL285_055393 [Trifolium repens]|nr:hypothetical protein QL285_055393 [Trifolium repens]